MADYAVTVADIEIKSANAKVLVVQCGEAVDQGETVYQSDTDQKFYLADANDGAAKAITKGIALTKCSAANGYAVIITGGEIDLGGTAAVGVTYYQSVNPGGIAPVGDLGTGHYVTRIGIGKTAANILLGIEATGIQHA
jgi:hypothetical protein